MNKKRLIAISATAAAALFLVATTVEQAAAQRGGHSGGGPSGGPSMGRSGGPGAGPSAGPRSMGPSGGRYDGRGPSARSFSSDRSRSFSYAPRYDGRDRGDGRRHVRRFRGDRFFFGAPYYDSYYDYGSCAYYYERAVATGSGYWWNRYYACTGEY